MSDSENGFRAPPPGELAPLFPKYRILSLIATGGMGAIYHAVQTSLEREVAIKILPVEFGKDSGFREAFAAEARAMAKLNHPNLIGVYDYGDVNGMLFIVMEHVSGQSMHHACHGCAVDPAEVIRLLTKICQGMAHAHENGILHRDIKPANILLDAHLQPKIGDFGLARPIEAQVGEGEVIYGTPGYTAPEVLEAPHTIDQRADIFSLGVLLHELLTGLLPTSDPRPASALSQCDPRFDAVVRKATQPNPHQRYQSVEEIAEALQKIASHAGPRASRTRSSAVSRKPAAQLHPAQSTSKGGNGWMVILLLGVAALAVFLLRDRIFQTADPSPPPAPVAEHTPEPVPIPVVPQPEPVKPEPGPVVSIPEPVEPVPVPVVPEPVPVNPEPGPVVSENVAPPQPKFDVEGFLDKARTVMVQRCGPDIVRRDKALEKNLADFRSEAIRLREGNLPRTYHQAYEEELDDFIAQRKADGNRIGKDLGGKLKFKTWLVESHKTHQNKEARLDEQMMIALAEHQNTYLHGLGLRIKALQADDPAAAHLIKAETGKVAADPYYFVSLMQEANRKK